MPRRHAPAPPVILGICGGFQMIGEGIDDPAAVESADVALPGLGWLRVRTVYDVEKVTRLAVTTGPDGAPATRLRDPARAHRRPARLFRLARRRR